MKGLVHPYRTAVVLDEKHVLAALRTGRGAAKALVTQCPVANAAGPNLRRSRIRVGPRAVPTAALVNRFATPVNVSKLYFLSAFVARCHVVLPEGLLFATFGIRRRFQFGNNPILRRWFS